MILTNFQSCLRIRTLKRYDEFNAFHSETLDGGAGRLSFCEVIAPPGRDPVFGMTGRDD